MNQNKYPGQVGAPEKVEAVGARAGRLALPGAMETTGFVDEIDRRAQNKIDLLDGVQVMAEPYRDAIIGELIARAPQHRKRVAPPPPYAHDPAAWKKYVGKKAETITWSHVEGNTGHTFTMTYLPEKDGNRLVGFTSNTREKKPTPDGRRGNDSFTRVSLSFDRGELVEAGLEQHTLSQVVDGMYSGYEPRPARGVHVTVGTEPTITYPDTDDTVYTYNQTVDDGAFVNAAGRKPPTSRDGYMQQLGDILGAVPTVSPQPTEL